MDESMNMKTNSSSHSALQTERTGQWNWLVQYFTS